MKLRLLEIIILNTLPVSDLRERTIFRPIIIVTTCWIIVFSINLLNSLTINRIKIYGDNKFVNLPKLLFIKLLNYFLWLYLNHQTFLLVYCDLSL